jgi:antitoxin component HigA of HigAB toxin-antitoxin module
MSTIRTKRGRDTYLDLVRRFPLRPIRSPAEHARAKRVYLLTSSRVRDRGTRDYLGVLADLIANYEQRTRQTVDTSGVTAADLVRHRMRERGLSISALARAIDVAQPNLSGMLSGRRAWSKAAVLSLSRMLTIPAERFLE